MDKAKKPTCDRCGQALDQFGAILVEPGKDSEVERQLLCESCYRQVVENA